MSQVKLRSDVTVKLVDFMGRDDSIVKAMLVSTQGTDAYDAKATPGRIDYLMRAHHGSPFEHNSMTFLIEAPIFVFREFHRHRVGWSYNETSGRYRELEPVFYIPSDIRPLIQVGKPGAYEFIAGSDQQFSITIDTLTEAYESAWAQYIHLLEIGIAKEIARVCLPVGTYSAMFATCNARSLMHFLSLRTRDERAAYPSTPQYEIELVALEMEKHFARLFPMTYDAFCKFGRVAP